MSAWQQNKDSGNLSTIRGGLGRVSPKRIAGVAGITLLGSLLVLGSLIVMNQFVDGPEERDVENAVSFSVPPPQPDPKPKPQQPQRRRPRRTNRPALAPPPNLGSSLSGIAVALPEFGAQGLSTVSESLLGELDDVALTENEVDEKPVPSPSNSVQFPERAKQREIDQGLVKVSVLIGTDGKVKQMKVLDATNPVFAKEVRQSIPNWTFQPARYKGQPVETWVEIPIRFSTS
jgi:protein TonB